MAFSPSSDWCHMPSRRKAEIERRWAAHRERTRRRLSARAKEHIELALELLDQLRPIAKGDLRTRNRAVAALQKAWIGIDDMPTESAGASDAK